MTSPTKRSTDSRLSSFGEPGDLGGDAGQLVAERRLIATELVDDLLRGADQHRALLQEVLERGERQLVVDRAG